MYNINYDSIDFFWDTEKIFDLVSHKSGVRAKNMKLSDDEGSEMDFIITEDDREFFDNELEGAVRALYAMFIDIALSEGDSCYISEPSATLGIFISGFAVKCNRDPYGALVVPEKRVGAVSTLCEEYIVNYVVDKWSEVQQLKGYESINKEVLERLLIGITQLKKRSYTNSYS